LNLYWPPPASFFSCWQQGGIIICVSYQYEIFQKCAVRSCIKFVCRQFFNLGLLIHLALSHGHWRSPSFEFFAKSNCCFMFSYKANNWKPHINTIQKKLVRELWYASRKTNLSRGFFSPKEMDKDALVNPSRCQKIWDLWSIFGL
jgi:hypothetical protein